MSSVIDSYWPEIELRPAIKFTSGIAFVACKERREGHGRGKATRLHGYCACAAACLFHTHQLEFLLSLFLRTGKARFGWTTFSSHNS